MHVSIHHSSDARIRTVLKIMFPVWLLLCGNRFVRNDGWLGQVWLLLLILWLMADIMFCGLLIAVSFTASDITTTRSFEHNTFTHPNSYLVISTITILCNTNQKIPPTMM